MKTFISSDILDRLRRVLSLSNDTELAATLGVKKATLSNWRSRNSLDWPLLFSVCEHIDLNWLIWGSDNEASTAKTPITNSSDTNALVIHLDNKIKEKDCEIGDLREEIGHLKARIEELQRIGLQKTPSVYAPSPKPETVPT